MRLKSLEISGFKSFANKTVFSFPASLAAVVGPNGSGKSNVADAISWVLGARDFKGLRVSKSEDIIFGGSPQKARMSQASVSLVLDNSQKKAPLDWEEIVVCRKINRAGESQYLINGSSARLKDIVELLAKAKIGYNGITIISQGSADAILRANPRERRLMIEENLGLKEFQLKKNECQRKLIATGENLEQTRNLIEEILPHLRSLRRQLARWEKREDLAGQLEMLEKIFFSFQFKDIFFKKEELDKKYKQVEEEIKRQKKELALLEFNFEKLNKEKPDFSAQFKKLNEEREEIDNKKEEIIRKVGRLEGQLESLNKISLSTPVLERKFNLSLKQLEEILTKVKDVLEKSLGQKNLENCRRELEELSIQIKGIFSGDQSDSYQKEKNEISSEKKLEVEKMEKEISIEKEKLLKLILDLEEKEKNLDTQLGNLRQKDSQAGLQAREILEKLEAKRREINDWNQKINLVSLDKERARIKEEDLKDKLKESGLRFDSFSPDEIKNIQVERELEKIGFQNDISQLENKIFRLRREVGSLGEVDELIAQEAKETEERYEFLSTELADLEKAKNNLEKLINELTEKIDGIFSSALKEINEEFNNYFRVMFGGGRARLNLVYLSKVRKEEEGGENSGEDSAGETDNTDEKEPSFAENSEDKSALISQQARIAADEAGIEFSLELPKKKVNSLEVLSGGERTLVAISILFAIVAAMEPPFVVLDEVDAALDESNARKFSRIMSQLAGKTQFVVITHNRATMESAQTLYGITMSEQGVSKAVSLKLEEEK